MHVTPQFPSAGADIGRFRVVSQLGAGGMGVVYEALEVNLDRKVALKIISPQLAGDPDFRDRFTSEARALASLDSPNVVQVYAHGEEDGYLYIATQLVPDGDLGQMLTKWGAAPLGKALELIEQVASGLHDAHSAGFVHRDIKPGNVLVRRRGVDTVQAYLGDFGIARRVDAAVTRVGGVAAGTPSYMAPELHAGGQAGIATDIYSLGCLLWVTLTGKPPFGGNTEYEIAGGHINKPVPQLPVTSPLTEAVNRVLRVSMAKEPGHRYRSAQALREDLRDCLQMTHDPAYHQLTSALIAAAGGSAAAGHSAPSGPSGPSAPSRPPGASGPSNPSAGSGSSVPRSFAATAAGSGPSGPPPGSSSAQYASGSGAQSGRRAADKPSRRGLWVVLAAAAVAIVIGGVAALVAGMGGGDGGNGGNAGNGGNGGNSGGGRSAEGQAFLDSDAPTILQAAKDDMAALQSTHLSGKVDQDGQETAADLTITASGDCDGEMRVGEGTAKIRRLDGTTWLKPDRGFLEASNTDGSIDVDTFIKLVGDRWLQADSSQSADFEDICNITSLLEGSGTDNSDTAVKGDVSEIDGEEVVKITNGTGSDEVTAYVRVEAPHYVVKLESTSDQGDFTFGKFDEPFEVTAPPEDEVLDFNSVG